MRVFVFYRANIHDTGANMSRLRFKLEATAQGTQARAGSFTTLHGEVKTPVFMPVGTQATVKTQSVDLLAEAGSSVLLANTYHLLLRPGAEVFRKVGGIHRFMHWNKPVLTDSGGFQIFSLPHSREMTEDGAHFKSYVDGKLHVLSPESSIEMQTAIQSDIMMVLDQCIPSTSDHGQAVTAMNLTHRWALRSLEARARYEQDGRAIGGQSLFGIIQGACFKDLREKSAEVLTQLPFDGFAIGGLAVGEGKDLRDEFTEFSAKLLPQHLPRYLMGVGTPIDILEAVHRGVDLFDCILPGSLAQRGVAFTSHGKMQLRRSVYKFSEEKLDADCVCPTCARYSRAYLHHLVKTEEVLGWQLLATHNIWFYHCLMREMRESIFENRFVDYYHETKPRLMMSDEDYPVVHQKRVKPKRERFLKLGDYEIAEKSGHSSIRQISSGEIMHSVSDPAEEAKRLYVEQSQLSQKLSESRGDSAREVVIWDVGLGAASNAMAAIECAENLLAKNGLVRALKIVSFEVDLDPLRLALRHATRFSHLRHAGPHQLIEKGEWTHPSGLISWHLRGDFLASMNEATKPDLIFYDPFSYKVDAPLWTTDVFQKLFETVALEKPECEFFTYSASTAVRVALLLVGFTVASGVATGPKSETTVAFSTLEYARSRLKASLLGAEWLKRWGRSQAKYPAITADLSSKEVACYEEQIETRIRNLQQFSDLATKT